MVVADYYSKWTEAYAIKNHTAVTVADTLMKEFICRYTIPSQIHTDQGREFESNLISELCKLLGIRKTRTTPYNPKSDGLVERFNRTLQQMLTTLVNDARNDWDEHLPYIMMAYRSSVHESTKCTPNMLWLNQEGNYPLEFLVGTPSDGTEPACPVEYVEWVRMATEFAFEFVLTNLKASAERQKLLYDRTCGKPKFKVGDTVWRYYPPTAKQKLGKAWQGPFLITRRLTDLTYEIQQTQNTRSIVVHVDHLKQYEGRNPIQNWLIQGEREGDTGETTDQPDQSDREEIPSQPIDEVVNFSEPEIEVDFVPEEQTHNTVDNFVGENEGAPLSLISNIPNTNVPVRRTNRPRKPKELPEYEYY
jgi:hypothetical protein